MDKCETPTTKRVSPKNVKYSDEIHYASQKCEKNHDIHGEANEIYDGDMASQINWKHPRRKQWRKKDENHDKDSAATEKRASAKTI